MLKTYHYRSKVIHYRENTVDEDVLDHSFDQDIFYKEVKDLKVGKGMVIVDVGAHIGTFSILSSMISEDNLILSIEPFQETFQLLEKNVNANDLKNIIPVNAALSNSDGETKLFLSNQNWEHSITHNFGSDFQLVKTITLGSLFRQFDIQECDLVKLNCEGAEFEIIPSLSSELLGKIKMLLVLFHEDMVHDRKREILIDHLTANDFLIRYANLKKDRGWIIAKNKKCYSVPGHFIYGYKRKWDLLKTRFRSFFS